MYCRKTTRLILAMVATALVLLPVAVLLFCVFIHRQGEVYAMRTIVVATVLLSLLIGGALMSILTFILKRAERAGRADRILLKLNETALESMEDGIVFTDRNEHPVWFNTALLQMASLAKDKTDRIPILLPRLKSHYPEFYKDVRERIQNGDIWSGTIETEATGGTGRMEEITVTPLRIESDEIDHFVAVRRDLTKKNRLKEELLAARSRAAETDHIRCETLTGLSDDLRPPILDIMGAADRALADGSDGNQTTHLETIYSSAEILIRTMQDALDFARLETGTIELSPEPFQLRTTIGNLMKGIAPRAHGRNLELILRISPDIPEELVGDSRRLRQVLLSLLDNALHFTRQGEIRMEARVLRKETNQIAIEFEVSDSGAAIPRDALAAINESLAQGEKPVLKQPGVIGLGLTISSRLVKMMNGTIRMESNPEYGNTFRFDSLFDVSSETPAHLPLPDALRNQKMKVLIVDDNKSNREIVSEIMSRFGLEPICADTPDTAASLVADSEPSEQPFGLAIIDSTMTATSGMELIENLREKYLLNCPVILMTKMERGNELKPTIRQSNITSINKPVQESGLRDAIVNVVTRETDYPEPIQPESLDSDVKMDRPLRILLAEDHPVNQKLAIRSLEKKGYHVTIANNGIEAVLACEQETFDVILMDLLMPMMDGIEAAKTIRESEVMTGERTPIIALTANAGPKEKERCRNAGMDEFLSKPVRAGVLYETIRGLTLGTTDAGSTELEQEPSPSKSSVSSLLEGIDIDSALELVDGDEGILKEMAGILIDCMPNMLTNIREAIDESDRNKLVRAAHNMKGSVGNLCATDAMDAAARVEMLAQDGDMSAAVTAAGILVEVVERLKPSLDRLSGRIV